MAGYVQSNVVDTSGASTSSSVAFTQKAQTAGNINIVCIGFFGSQPTPTTPTDTSLNTYVLLTSQVLTTTKKIYMYAAYNIKAAAAGANTVTTTYVSSTFAELAIAEYSGIGTAIGAQPDVTGGNSNSANQFLTVSLTTLYQADVFISYGNEADAHQVGQPANFSANRLSGATFASWISDNLGYNPTGAYSITFTGDNGGSDTLMAVVAAFKVTFLPPSVGEARVTPVVIPSGNSTTAGNVPQNIIDDNAMTFWESNTSSGDWVGLDAGAPVLVSRFRLSSRGGYEDYLIGATIQGTNDPTFATGLATLYTVGLRPNTGTLLNEFDVFNPTGTLYRYYRLLSAGGAQFGELGDLEIICTQTPPFSGACVDPVISPGGRHFDTPILISFTTLTQSATLYYTTNGQTPVPGATGTSQYTGPFTLSSTATVSVIATATSLSSSRVVSAKFYCNPDQIIPIDIEYDDRNYYILGGDGHIYKDPNSNFWYAFRTQYDQPGVFSGGGLGIAIYKSADLRNWKFVSVMGQPSAGNMKNNTNYPGRASVIFNAANTNYVCWQHLSPGAQEFGVYTATNIEGPWTFVANRTSITTSNIGCDGDFCFFDDTATSGSVFIFWSSGSSNSIAIAPLDANYQNCTGAVTANFSLSGANPFGQKSEAHTVFKRGSTYFWMASGYTAWQPNTNLYVTNSTIASAGWSAAANPFQATTNQNALGMAGLQYGSINATTVGYDTQVEQILQIPGRTDGSGTAWYYLGDRWDNGLVNPSFQSAAATMTNYRRVKLPVSFPSSTSMQISWVDTWNFDVAFPNSSGAPAAPTGLAPSGSVTGPTFNWTNNETNPHNLYIDVASDPAFANILSSQSLPQGTTQATPPFNQPTPAFYRIRAVNASGSTASVGVIVNGRDAAPMTLSGECCIVRVS